MPTIVLIIYMIYKLIFFSIYLSKKIVRINKKNNNYNNKNIVEKIGEFPTFNLN